MGKFQDLTGQTFGNLKVIGKTTDSIKNKKAKGTITLSYSFYHKYLDNNDNTILEILKDNIHKFCKDNNIPLLRISYWRFRKPYSYKTILKDFLDSLQQP